MIAVFRLLMISRRLVLKNGSENIRVGGGQRSEEWSFFEQAALSDDIDEFLIQIPFLSFSLSWIWLRNKLKEAGEAYKNRTGCMSLFPWKIREWIITLLQVVPWFCRDESERRERASSNFISGYFELGMTEREEESSWVFFIWSCIFPIPQKDLFRTFRGEKRFWSHMKCALLLLLLLHFGSSLYFHSLLIPLPTPLPSIPSSSSSFSCHERTIASIEIPISQSWRWFRYTSHFLTLSSSSSDFIFMQHPHLFPRTTRFQQFGFFLIWFSSCCAVVSNHLIMKSCIPLPLHASSGGNFRNPNSTHNLVSSSSSSLGEFLNLPARAISGKPCDQACRK